MISVEWPKEDKADWRAIAENFAAAVGARDKRIADLERQLAERSAPSGEAVAEMRQTARDLRENSNGDCGAVRQAIYWDKKADALASPTAGAVPSDMLARLRAEGWQVAVHNDYRQNGKFHTFWLLTHSNGRWAKGEGVSDAVALAQVMDQALAAAPTPPPVQPVPADFAETLNFYISDSQNGISRIPRAKLVEIQAALASLTAKETP